MENEKKVNFILIAQNNQKCDDLLLDLYMGEDIATHDNVDDGRDCQTQSMDLSVFPLD